MGLDMYLTKKTYIGAQYEYRNVKGVIEITEGKDNKPVNIKFNRVCEISERVGYWRKANAIHNWFVTNVQGGEDNCQEYEVSEEKLNELLANCKEVLQHKGKAASKIPTKGGFFFGGTDYDDGYFEDISDTIKIIEDILAEKPEGQDYLGGDIYYRSSW